jgi:hypothetical protein
MADPVEAKIDEIIATCDGDLRGALRALLLVNEHLEFELQRLRATGTLDEAAERHRCCINFCRE